MSDFSRVMEYALINGIATAQPRNTVTPAVTPLAPAAGDALSCTTGEWTGEPDDYAYSWRQSGNPAEIGTSSVYQTIQQDADTSVHCLVAATNDVGTVLASSNTVYVSKK